MSISEIMFFQVPAHPLRSSHPVHRLRGNHKTGTQGMCYTIRTTCSCGHMKIEYIFCDKSKRATSKRLLMCSVNRAPPRYVNATNVCKNCIPPRNSEIQVTATLIAIKVLLVVAVIGIIVLLVELRQLKNAI